MLVLAVRIVIYVQFQRIHRTEVKLQTNTYQHNNHGPYVMYKQRSTDS